MRYAPKLLDLSADERWKLGFEHRVEQMANKIHAEIRAMAHKARAEFHPNGMWHGTSFIQSGIGVMSFHRANPSFWHLP